MSLTRTDLLFIALGVAVGIAVALAAKAGLIAVDGAFPPFVWVLIGLGFIEVGLTLAARKPPGAFVSLGTRLVALAVGVAANMIFGPILG